MELPINQIIHGDCLEVMKKWPDKCIDLVLTDPPYGIDMSKKLKRMPGNNIRTGDYGDLEWDSTIPSENIFREIFRISKNQVIFGGNYLTEYLSPSRCWVVWYKRPVGNNSPCELAWTSFKTGGVKHFEFLWEGYWQEDMKNKDPRIHPTQKPVKLMEYCLQEYSKEGDIVLDPFGGSCTTAVAAENLKRKWICIEKEEKYVKICHERMDSLTKKLF